MGELRIIQSFANLINNIKFRLNGYLYIGNEKKSGWKENIPFYLLECPIHGFVKTYAMGLKTRLECPDCIKDRIARIYS
jgi:hypothetical protein